MRPIQLLFMFAFILAALSAVQLQAESAKPAAIGCRMEEMPGYKMEPFVPVLDISRLASAPQVDGVIKAEEWAGAATIDNFLVPGSTSNAAPATKCRLGFDAKALYLAFRCEMDGTNAPLAVVKNHDNSKLFYDDSVELFFLPDGAKPDYYQVAVNSLGATYDTRYFFNNMIGAKSVSDLAWSQDWKIAVKPEANAWTVEVAIPWQALKIDPTGTKAFRFNLCRNTTPAVCQNSSWAWLPKLAFQLPERFGVGVCSFDSSGAAKANLAETGLGLAGMCRVEPLNGDDCMSFSNKIEIIYTAAFPSHPLFVNKKYEIKIDKSGLDAKDWKLNPPVEIGRFDLAPARPQKIVISNAGADADFLRLRLMTSGATVYSSAFFPNALPIIARMIRQADIPALVKKDPFKLLNCYGVMAEAEKVRAPWMLGWPEGPLISIFRGIKARVNAHLDVLASGTTGGEPGSLLDLLNLAGAPEAQVAVEYTADYAAVQDFSAVNMASVNYYWGAIPLCNVMVKQFPDHDQAVKDMNKGATNEPKDFLEGNPAVFESRRYDYGRFSLKLFDPAGHLLVVKKSNRGAWGMVVPADCLEALAGADFLRVDCATAQPDCPAGTLAKFEAWVSKNNSKSVPLEEALKANNILFAGDPQKVKDKLGISDRALIIKPAKEVVNASAVRANRLFSIGNAPSRAVAELALRLTVRGKAVRPSEVDDLRREIIKAIKPEFKTQKLPEGMRLFCGDTHMHTTYSDGQTPPLATALEAMYCSMDFAVMTDHNRIDSGVLVQGLFKECGVDYPVIVGEEITTKWAHLNAYPLKEVIAPTNAPAETTAAAHAQGAVIQWNHPGFTTSEFESGHLLTGLAGTGCDAWEHYTDKYADWKKAGTLPTLVGSSDTHNGTFGGDERTMILAPSPDGKNLAEAIRKGKTVLISTYNRDLFYGSDEMLDLAWTALSEGKKIKAEFAERLKNAVKNADLPGLLTRSKAAAPQN